MFLLLGSCRIVSIFGLEVQKVGHPLVNQLQRLPEEDRYSCGFGNLKTECIDRQSYKAGQGQA